MNEIGGEDFMEVNNLIPLKNGWFLDKNTNTKFRVREDGAAIDENGNVLREADPPVGPNATFGQGISHEPHGDEDSDPDA